MFARCVGGLEVGVSNSPRSDSVTQQLLTYLLETSRPTAADASPARFSPRSFGVDRTPHHAAVGRHPLSARGSMVALSVQTFAPNVSLLALLALLDRLLLSPVITRRLGGKAARRADG